MLNSGLNRQQYVTSSAEETIALGKKFGADLPANSVLCFFGNLAAGKTTLIKGIASAFSSSTVSSPTFVYLNIYEGSQTIYHFDLYRLAGAEDFLSMGFEDYLFAGGICCVEWSERISELLPVNRWELHLNHVEGGKRAIEIVRLGDKR